MRWSAQHRNLWQAHQILILAVTTVLLVCFGSVSAARRAGVHPDSVFITVNIPAGRLTLWRGEEQLRTYPVVVGAQRFPTPTGSFAVTEITWNPWWLPPPSDWAREEKPIPPGPTNPMGRVKLQFRTYYYLHGTADTTQLGRAASHGCIRLRNADAQELAALVHELTGMLLDRAQLDQLLQQPRRTQRFVLPRSVPVSIRYDRVEIDDSLITIFPDPYRRGTPSVEELSAMLERVSLDGSVVDTARLRAVLDLPSARTVVVPVTSVVRTPKR